MSYFGVPSWSAEGLFLDLWDSVKWPAGILWLETARDRALDSPLIEVLGDGFVLPDNPLRLVANMAAHLQEMRGMPTRWPPADDPAMWMRVGSPPN